VGTVAVTANRDFRIPVRERAAMDTVLVLACRILRRDIELLYDLEIRVASRTHCGDVRFGMCRFGIIQRKDQVGFSVTVGACGGLRNPFGLRLAMDAGLIIVRWLVVAGRAIDFRGSCVVLAKRTVDMTAGAIQITVNRALKCFCIEAVVTVYADRRIDVVWGGKRNIDG
jgi:hypothetical protein